MYVFVLDVVSYQTVNFTLSRVDGIIVHVEKKKDVFTHRDIQPWATAVLSEKSIVNITGETLNDYL